MEHADTSSSLWTIGRFIIGATFVTGGLPHIPLFGVMADVFRTRGVPLPRIALALGTAFQIVAGTLFALGFAQRELALGLILFTVAASVIMHDFWAKSGHERFVSLIGWQSNLAIIGGLLLTIA